MKPGDSSNGTADNSCRKGRWFREKFPQFLLGLLLWFSFIKLPATVATSDDPSPTWEAVLSYAVSHHLQWGRDIVFNYGPLGFLTSDYYWGGHFWFILFWAFGFALFLTMALMPFLGRVASPIRITLCVLLPWLTVPRWQDLGVDPIYLFAITVIGVAGLPGERPGNWRLALLGLALGWFGLIKFTFCLYSIFTALVIAALHARNRNWRATGIFIASLLVSFLAAWLLAGQDPRNLGRWFQSSAQIAGAYSSAMAILPPVPEIILGVSTGLCLAGLLLAQWLNSKKSPDRFPRLVLLVAGIFLAWKEGFVRADIHISVFLLYAFLIAGMMPALLRITWEKNFPFLPLTLAMMILPLLPFTQRGAEFLVAAKDGLALRVVDTATAVFAPLQFQHLLEAQLAVYRQEASLPKIATFVGNQPVDALNCDQDVAILNGFNYHPHPVFQSYCAHTPELQRLNLDFFNSSAAPEFVLWQYGTIDGRFPTLDDGQVILKLLADYSPAVKEGRYVLWKREAASERSYSLADPVETQTSAEQWIPISADATWLQVELRETWFGRGRKLFYRGAMPEIDVQLADGRILSYRLPPGNARAGFIINPLLDSGASLEAQLPGSSKPARVVAARIHINRWCFDDSIRIVMRKIEGVPALEINPAARNR